MEEEVFKQAYIPQRLTEVIDFERDINQAKSGQTDSLVYKTLVGLKSDLSGTVQQPEILENLSISKSVSDDDTSSVDEEEEDDDDGTDSKFQDSSRPKHETLEEKKLRKKAVKEAQAEKRKTKIKKYIKKRKEKPKK